MNKAIIRLKLMWWAMLGRPIIHGCAIKPSLELYPYPCNANIFIANNYILGENE